MKSPWKTAGLGFVLALAAVASPVLAHHSSAMYDREKPLTVDADVKSFQWLNPHSVLTVVTRARPGGEARTWTIEMTSPGVLTRAGWTKRSFNPGDRIKVEFAPMRNGAAGGYFLKATLADGKVMAYDFGENSSLQ